MTHDIWGSFKSHCVPVVSYTIDHPPEIRPYDSGLVNQLVSLKKTLRCGEGGGRLPMPWTKKPPELEVGMYAVHHLAIPVKHVTPSNGWKSWPSNDPGGSGDQVGSRIEKTWHHLAVVFFQRSSVFFKQKHKPVADEAWHPGWWMMGSCFFLLSGVYVSFS